MFLKFKKLKILKKVFSKFKRTKHNRLDDTVEGRPELSLKKTFFLHSLAIIIFGLAIIPITYIQNINPLIKAVQDLTFSDLYFSKIRTTEKSDTTASNIYLVDIDSRGNFETRKQLVSLLTELNKAKNKPKVIGIDVMFKYKVDRTVDDELSYLLKNENMVLVDELVENEYEENEYQPFPLLDKFSKNCTIAYGHQYIAKDGRKTERSYIPIHRYDNNNSEIKHFAYAVAEKFDSSISNVFEKRINLYKQQMINYRGNYAEKVISIEDTNKYHLLKDKIVLIGLCKYNYSHFINSLGATDSTQLAKYTDDLHWTPKNQSIVGRSAPDMYGIEIQAHIVASIINDDTIASSWFFSKVIQLLGAGLIYFFLLYLYKRKKMMFLVFKIVIQFVFALGFLFLSIFQIPLFNYYLDYTILALVSFFAAEFVSTIDGVSLGFYNKFFVNHDSTNIADPNI